MPKLCLPAFDVRRVFQLQPQRCALIALAVFASHRPAPAERPPVDRPQGSVVGWGEYVIGGDISRDVVAVATSRYHALALKKDGSIVAWGEVDAHAYKGNDFVQIAAGKYHTVALKKDGSVISSGCQYTSCRDCGHYVGCYGWDPLPTPNTGFIQVVVGDRRDFGLRNDGVILAWEGTSPSWGTTIVIAQNTGVTSIWGGGGGLLGLRPDGSVWSPYGPLPPSNTGFIALAAGDGHYLGLKADGSIEAWGDNDFGQLDLPAPNSDFVAISAGPHHSVGLKTDGTVVSWGCHQVYCHCQETCCDCGNPPSPCYCAMEVANPSNNSGFVSISAGFMSGIGVKADGSVARWGYAPGNGPNPNSGIVAVFGRHAALRADGSLALWGCLDNEDGACDVPAPNENFVDFAAGNGASFGLKADGKIIALHCHAERPAMCQIPEPNADFIDVAALDQVLGLKSDGSIVAWGDCSYGQCNIPEPNADFVTVGAQVYKSLGLKSDGSVVQWGCLGIYPPSCGGVPTPESSYVAMSTIGNSTVAVESNGRVVNFELENCVPTPNSGFVAATTNGWDEFSALKNDGSIHNTTRYNCLNGQSPPPNNASPNVGFVALGFQTAVKLRPGDFDGDGLVDLLDVMDFAECFAGPEATPQPQRWRFLDFDDDFDVDLADFRLAQNSYTGSNP